MYKKLLGIFVVTLLIATALPTTEAIKDVKDNSSEIDLIKNGYMGKLGGDEEIIIDEDFEEGWSPDSNRDLAPPFLWEMEHTTTEINGGIPCWWHKFEEMGENYAGLWWGYQPQDEWLMTRSFDLSVYAKATLEFLTWNHGFFYGHWEGDFVEISIDGGSNWDVLANLYDLAPPGDSFSGELLSFDLTPYCGYSSVIVAFHRLTDDPNMNAAEWMIDNVLITAYDMVSFPVLDIKSISGGFGVIAELENLGTGDATNVEWSISIDGDLILSGEYKEGIVEIIKTGDNVGITSSVFGFLWAEIKVKVDNVEETSDAFILGPFALGVEYGSWIPVNSYTINWRQCTVTVNARGVTGRHSVQFVDRYGNIIRIESEWDFGTSESATGNVENWIKNKLRNGGSINVRV